MVSAMPPISTFSAPVKLAGITGRKDERHHTSIAYRVCADFTASLRSVARRRRRCDNPTKLKEAGCKMSLRLGRWRSVASQLPARTGNRPLGRRLMRTKINRLPGLQVLVVGRGAGMRNRADASAADQMTTPDFGYDLYG